LLSARTIFFFSTPAVVLLGEGNSGKTSMVARFVHDTFTPEHIVTTTAGVEKKKIVLADNKRVELNIWDTAGQEKFHTLGVIYYRNADGAILVYDITDRNSFDRVQTWIKELHKTVGSDIVTVIVGNKTDLEKHRTVTKEEAEKYAQSVGAAHFNCSAKFGNGIKDIFSELTRRIVVKEHAPEKRSHGHSRFTLDDQQLDDKFIPNNKEEGCCSS